MGKTISDSWWARIKRVIEYVERYVMGSQAVTQRKPRILVGTTTEANSGGGGGGGGCCCQEGSCLHIPGIEDEDLKVAYYWFDAVNPCGCEGVPRDGNIKLYPEPPANPTKWKSKIGPEELRCRYPNCSATTAWKWLSGEWVAQSTSNASCGTPPSPDFDGEEEGQDAETTFEPPLQDSYWIREGDSLKWYIGDEVVADYVLDSVRGFSRLCINTFRLATDTRLKCGSSLPPTICLNAGVPSGPVLFCGENALTLPTALVLSITDFTGGCYPMMPESSMMYLDPSDPEASDSVAVYVTPWFVPRTNQCPDGPTEAGGLCRIRLKVNACGGGSYYFQWDIDDNCSYAALGGDLAPSSMTVREGFVLFESRASGATTAGGGLCNYAIPFCGFGGPLTPCHSGIITPAGAYVGDCLVTISTPDPES